MITSVMLPRQIPLLDPLPTKLTPSLRYFYRLFVAPKNINSFGIKQIQALSAKYRGGVYLAHLLRRCTTIPHRFATSLFSWSYELFFSQLLSFQKHLRCPIVFSKSVVHSQFRNSRWLRTVPSRSTFNCRLSTALPVISHLSRPSNLSTFNRRLSTALLLS